VCTHLPRPSKTQAAALETPAIGTTAPKPPLKKPVGSHFRAGARSEREHWAALSGVGVDMDALPMVPYPTEVAFP
jgi:hypothetical protein